MFYIEWIMLHYSHTQGLVPKLLEEYGSVNITLIFRGKRNPNKYN